MITLYGVPGACSMAPHIVLEELKLHYNFKLVQWSNKPLRDEMKKLNPMGQVPTLVTNEGYPLAEGAAIMQYLASQKPGTVFPESGQERFKAFEWMNFLASELHKSFIPLFKPAVYSDDESHHEALKKKAVQRIAKLFEVAEQRFSNENFCLGKQFSIADAYLFTVLTWAQHLKVDFIPFKKLSSFFERMLKRPSVLSAMKAEGLLQ